MSRKTAPSLETIIARDGRYPLEAYHFLQAGLEHTATGLYGEEPDASDADSGGKSRRAARRPRHITGQQLCEGLRDFAIQLWGPMAADVLAEWRISSTRDFGAMVYLLVEHGMLATHPDDSPDDFDDVYDFAAAFGGYRVSSAIVAEDGEGDC